MHRNPITGHIDELKVRVKEKDRRPGVPGDYVRPDEPEPSPDPPLPTVLDPLDKAKRKANSAILQSGDR